MEGVDPSYKDMVEAFFNQLMKEYPEEAIKAIGLKGTQATKARNKLRRLGKDIVSRYKDESHQYRLGRHIGPVMKRNCCFAER